MPYQKSSLFWTELLYICINFLREFIQEIPLMFLQTEPISEKISRVGLVTKHGIFY